MLHRKILLHIGYHKTGSTFLQKRFFGSENTGFALPNNMPRHALVEDIVSPAPFCFDHEEARAKYQPHIDAAEQAERTLVVSHERLSGYPPTGGFDAKEIGIRLATTFPEAGVLAVVREQSAATVSMYSQYITDGGDLTMAQFFDRIEPHLHRVPGFSFDFYRYDLLIGHYRNLFGADNVLVLPYEALRADPLLFLSQICRFVGVPEIRNIEIRQLNAQRPVLMQQAQRLVNAIFSSNQLSRRALFPIPRANRGFHRSRKLFNAIVPRVLEEHQRNRQEQFVASRIKGLYGKSNQNLSRMIGIDLGQYGYDLG